MKRQYVVSSFELKPTGDQFKQDRFEGLRVVHDAELDCCTAVGESRVLLLGFIVDPLRPERTNRDIVEEMSGYETTAEFLKRIQRFSGRYVILFKTSSEFIAINDACALRRLLYSFWKDRIVLTSSIKLYLTLAGDALMASERKMRFVRDQLFQKKEQFWVGDETVDDRFRKVLPNHCLDLGRRKIQRTPLFFGAWRAEGGSAESYLGRVLSGGIAALRYRYTVLQPLTAGWDTRVLLAATRPFAHEIRYYTFTTQLPRNHPDLRVPRMLAEKYHLNYAAVGTERLSDSFLRYFQAQFCFPNVLPKTRNIAYHYHRHSDGRYINVNGNGGEILRRCYHGLPFSDALFISKVIGYERIPFVIGEVRRWLKASKEFAKRYKIRLNELFYWEQRMGNWHARYQRDQDVAIEEFSPFNNKDLLLTGLELKRSSRRLRDVGVITSIVELLWPELLSIPINPSETVYGKVKGRIFRYPSVRTSLMYLLVLTGQWPVRK